MNRKNVVLGNILLAVLIFILMAAVTDDYASAPVNINPDVMPQMTMVAWVRPDDGSPIRQVISHDNGGYDR